MSTHVKHCSYRLIDCTSVVFFKMCLLCLLLCKVTSLVPPRIKAVFFRAPPALLLQVGLLCILSSKTVNLIIYRSVLIANNIR